MLGSRAVSPCPAPTAATGWDVDYHERPIVWFTYFLQEAGHVLLDERDCEGLWPRGVRHDDAPFCETGITHRRTLATGHRVGHSVRTS
ncbi:hypothetical protein GCM10011578_038940 [Streptomyces fuscichromogenes]|uniref:Uncharacterized protein n=1 Tax=Streptomyces fuscichromogenes TaxID=1324013 RepID=A0A917XEC0_9ACTN|nr:hypothetical protein GCM10011578_038940 [Streptomyces fuscichromogenes]